MGEGLFPPGEREGVVDEGADVYLAGGEEPEGGAPGCPLGADGADDLELFVSDLLEVELEGPSEEPDLAVAPAAPEGGEAEAGGVGGTGAVGEKIGAFLVRQGERDLQSVFLSDIDGALDPELGGYF